MEPRRKRVRKLSSTESDSSSEDVPMSSQDIDSETDMESQRSHNSGYDSEGNSSVESMDIIRYPSSSVLSKIEKSKSNNSKELDGKDCNKEKLKDKLTKSFTGKSKKSKVSAKQSKNKETFNKTVKKISKDLSISSKQVRKFEVRLKIVNNADVSSEKSKKMSSITKDNKNPNHSQNSTRTKDNNTVCKKTRLYQSVSNEEKESLSNRYEGSDTATCSYFQEKMPDMNQTKKSTVKKRPDNYGSRLNSLLTDFRSHANNKSQSSDERKQRPAKPKESWHIKYNESEKKSKTEIYVQNSNSLSAKKDLCAKSSPKAGKEEQTSTEGFNSKYLNNNDKLERSSNFYKIHQISKESITSNLETTHSGREFQENVSQPCNSLKSENKYSNELDEINKNMPCLNLIKIVVGLDSKWLEEKEKNKNPMPPPEFLESKEIKMLSHSFQSFDDYHKKYLSMLKLEIWEKICSSSKVNLSHRNKKFSFSIVSYDYVKDTMRLHCKSAVHVPTENSLVIVKLMLEDGQIKSTFGFIEQLECKSKDLGRNHKAPVKQLVFKMFVKGRMTRPQINCQMEGKFICSLYKETKQAEALHLMKFSPLLKDFLEPSWDTFCTSYKQWYNGDFFKVQQNISNVITEEINLSPSKTKVMLLQGPPGSGKTSTIVSIASNLLRNKEDLKKILIVAPSHFALDEIGNQLLNSNEGFNSKINFVRLGQIENIHHKLLDYSLHKYLEKYRMSYKNNSHLKIKTKHVLKVYDEQQEIGKILSDTSLVLAVPEDCWQLHKFKVKFSVCLIDEVNQGTELDTLYPFVLGISKFLLVADPMQLRANVESEMARKCGYQRCVMERFQLYFEMKKCKNPTIFLSEQFRINSHVSRFPFNRFYSDYRVRNSYADKRGAFCPINPYVVFDDQRHYGTKDFPYTEATGVNFIIPLCSFIIDKDATSSIGIIVPSEEEQRTYQAAIENIFASSIEVKTVDHFQGREKSVIILSCYHDFNKVVPFRTDYFSDVRKLNVALTRAINSLIICGPLHNLMKHNNIWSDIVTDSKKRWRYSGFKSLNEVQLSHLLYISNT